MRTTLRMFITVLAASALTFTGVAFAQEGDPAAECEASGGLWMEDFEGVAGLDLCHKYGHEIVECEAQGGGWCQWDDCTSPTTENACDETVALLPSSRCSNRSLSASVTTTIQ